MKRLADLFLYALLAGLCVGLGACVFLRVRDTFPGANVVGALLFSIGLLVICTKGYYLYTGKVCYVFERPASYLWDVAVIWLGNFAGCLLMTVLLSYTTLFGPQGINATAAALVSGKMSSSYLSLFLLGILCNFFIFIGVDAYANNPHEMGKYLGILLGVSCFILAGTEHCVADMFYWAASGILYEEPGQSLLRILIITLGNAVGGVFFPVMIKLRGRLAD